MGFFKDLSKRAKLPARTMPGGTSKNSKGYKIGGALALSPILGPANPLAYDPEVTGARGSAQNKGLSVDQAKEKKIGDAVDTERRQAAAAAAAAAAAEEPFTKAKQSQVEALKRKGRRASILTSSQGASDPLGIPG